jgi:very-short-patch-repair endonuclease
MTIRARNLRRDATDAERRLWSRLRGDQLGIRFRRQLVFERRYVLDFFAPWVKLAVEVDGGQHGVAISKDEARTGFLTKRGVTVLRFWNNEVLGNTDGVVIAIQAVIGLLTQQASPPAPLPEGVGGASGDAALEGLNVVFGEIDR